MQLFGWFEGPETGSICFAMEYISGGNLSQLIRKGGVNESDARTITKQLLEGLEIMHSSNLCHRDLKPQVGVSTSDPQIQ